MICNPVVAGPILGRGVIFLLNKLISDIASSGHISSGHISLTPI